jgi:transcription-repair coupling factor (superfamily II helicase)
MGEAELEQVMVGFWEKDYDVLVCTTIVESGLDIPNANTLIVDRADAFGLSQLHQIRGRVGRGRERAYAYFTYQPDKPLTELAHDRLATIAQNTEVGAGMAVAMKDLEIRGAGNLLGGEQSGHIASVGFDLYMRLVGEAVSDFKRGGGPEEEQVRDTKVDLPVDAHLPHDYIPGERLRPGGLPPAGVGVRRRGHRGARDELADRYGPLPDPVQRLLAVARFRAYARQFGPDRGEPAGHQRALRAAAAPGEPDDALQRLFPRSVVKPAVGHGARAATDDGPHRRAAAARRGAAGLGPRAARGRPRRHRRRRRLGGRVRSRVHSGRRLTVSTPAVWQPVGRTAHPRLHGRTASS